jgi:3-methyl-2-oxobutanoate hydroxymethyltransferase
MPRKSDLARTATPPASPPLPAKVRTATLARLKREGRPIVAATAYDWPSALALEEAGVDVCLVGDSLGMVVLGYESTVPVTLEEMIHHAKAVKRGLRSALLVVDLPFMSYQLGPSQALSSAGRILKETGAEAVKLEGGSEIAPMVRALKDAGVAVMGHIGLTPQSVHALGGWRIQGRGAAEARKLIASAKALEAAGAFAVVLEGIPGALAAKVTAALGIPTIGIGAGPKCGGQVQVRHDLLGALPHPAPRHAKAYASLYPSEVEALKAYAREVRASAFPTAKETPA